MKIKELKEHAIKIEDKHTLNELITYTEELKEIYYDSLGAIRRLNPIKERLEKDNELETKIGCPVDIIFKLAEQNELYYQFYDELQHYRNIKVDIKNKVVWFCKQVGGHYASKQPLSNYGFTFWLKEDKSE